MNNQFVFNTHVIFGYYRYEYENGRVARDGTDTRIGEIKLPTGRSLSGLRARATRTVKANPDMHEMLFSFIDDAMKDALVAKSTATEHLQRVWDFHYQGRHDSEWEDWKEPTQHAHHENVMITSRWKWIDRREWHHDYSAGHGGANPASLEIPDIRAYYALAYEGSLS